MDTAMAPRPAPVRPRLKWWPVLTAFAVALVGYFGAWIWHRAAGLVVTGVDLAEYVKFLPAFRAGQLRLLRESFYLPLAAGSLIAGLIASRRVLPVWLRWVSGLLAFPLALAMLPPAWSPGLLMQPEFRLQTVVLAGCIAALVLLLVTRYLPDALVLLLIALLALLAAIWPLSSFLPILPSVEALYRQPVRPGWGFWLSTAGFLLTALFSIVGIFPRRPQR
jgi:hypothetical protein